MGVAVGRERVDGRVQRRADEGSDRHVHPDALLRVEHPHEGVDIGRSLAGFVHPPAKGSPRYSSLRSFLAHGEAALCVPGMIRECGWKRMSLAEDSGRVVVVLRDSAIISRWFGLRPPTVSAGHRRPGFEAEARAVPVAYVRPQIPLPDSALRAEAEAAEAAEMGDPFRVSIAIARALKGT